MWFPWELKATDLILNLINVQHSIIKVIEEGRLRWFGHLKRKGSDIFKKKNYVEMKCRGHEEKGEAEGMRKKGKSRVQWADRIICMIF